MNMILHNEIYADIKQGDTINDPQFKDDDQLKTFDYIVANPPFSTKSWLKSAKTEDVYHRWGEGIKIGVPPERMVIMLSTPYCALSETDRLCSLHFASWRSI